MFYVPKTVGDPVSLENAVRCGVCNSVDLRSRVSKVGPNGEPGFSILVCQMCANHQPMGAAVIVPNTNRRKNNRAALGKLFPELFNERKTHGTDQT